MRVIAKKAVSRFVFMLELVVGLYLYLLGSGGIIQTAVLAHENHALERELTQLHSACTALQAQIEAWTHDSFYLEQCAREQLQMARADEEIYFVE